MTINAIEGIIALFLSAAFVFGPWQWYWSDRARQEIFECRDAIFDLAAEGRIAFDSVQYRVIRESLNAQIRFAHIATLPRVFFFWQAVRHTDLRAENPVRAALRDIEDDRLRAEIQNLVDQAFDAIVRAMVFKSLLLIGFALIFYGLSRTSVALADAGDRLKFKVKSWGEDLIQIEAGHAAA